MKVTPNSAQAAIAINQQTELLQTTTAIQQLAQSRDEQNQQAISALNTQVRVLQSTVITQKEQIKDLSTELRRARTPQGSYRKKSRTSPMEFASPKEADETNAAIGTTQAEDPEPYLIMHEDDPPQPTARKLSWTNQASQ